MGELHDVDGPALVLTIGPAASGKSTLLRELVATGVVDEVVSTDLVRAEHGLGPGETTTTYALARERVRAALTEDLVVAVDATNVRAQDRVDWLAVAVAAGATPVAVRVGVGLDLEQLLVRDAGRDRHVPADVIAEQLELARASTPAVLRGEGFVVVDSHRRRPVPSQPSDNDSDAGRQADRRVGLVLVGVDVTDDG